MPNSGTASARKLIVRGATHALRFLRHHLGETLLAVAVLYAGERLLDHLWLGQPLRTLFSDSLVSLPALVLLSLALFNITALPARLAISLGLFFTHYAQYAFQSYYGRFLGEGELRLAAANPSHEFIASVELYFSGAAFLAALAITALYALLLFRRKRASASYQRASFALLGLLSWCVLVDEALPSQEIYSPTFALAATNVRLGISRTHEIGLERPMRHKAPAPQNQASHFDVIYIIGESLRADRFSATAYGRNVTPLLSSLQLPHVSFENVTSHGDCTDRSVPLLMVEPVHSVYSDLFQSPSLFSYAKSAGYRTAFISANDNLWPEFVGDEIDVLHRNVAPAVGLDKWTFGSDNEMLPIITALAHSPDRQFLVVETYAAHWPYGDRYMSCPECRVYRPDLNGKAAAFSEENREQIVNSYDNAVIYFDRFVAKLIGGLRKSTLIVITSDHGESLGEDGKWGHCSAASEQVLVPLMLIATDDSVARAAGFASLSEKSAYPISHANIFPTLVKTFGYSLGNLGIPYAPDLDALTLVSGSDRRVLVSAIGGTEAAESFGVVDARRVLKR